MGYEVPGNLRELSVNVANQYAIMHGKRYSAPIVADPSLFLGNKNLPDGWYPDILVDMMSTNNTVLAAMMYRLIVIATNFLFSHLNGY